MKQQRLLGLVRRLRWDLDEFADELREDPELAVEDEPHDEDLFEARARVDALELRLAAIEERAGP